MLEVNRDASGDSHALGGLLSGLHFAAHGQQAPAPDLEAAPFSPRRYVAYRAPARLTVDGKLDEPAWAAAPWTDAFVDIEGDRRPPPRFRTRAKMLWDDEYFYVAAEMLEPHIWGTLTERDSVIFHDNDFEIFIDPDGDTHDYYEFEVNALGTAWDLMLPKPYRDGGGQSSAGTSPACRSASTCAARINGPATGRGVDAWKWRCRGGSCARRRRTQAAAPGDRGASIFPASSGSTTSPTAGT